MWHDFYATPAHRSREDALRFSRLQMVVGDSDIRRSGPGAAVWSVMMEKTNVKTGRFHDVGRVSCRVSVVF